MLHELETAAAEKYGLTNDWRKASFLLSDGSLLREPLSAHWVHGEITGCFPNSLRHFIEETNAIRVRYVESSAVVGASLYDLLVFEFLNIPTSAQMRSIYHIAQRNCVVVVIERRIVGGVYENNRFAPYSGDEILAYIRKFFIEEDDIHENPPHDYSFYTTCIRADGNAINEMVEDAIEIKYETMLQHCTDMLDIAEQIGYARRSDTDHGLTLKNDPYVGYYKSNYKGIPCYYFVWSSIEHIWLKNNCSAYTCE